MQPLDKTCFWPLKVQWDKELVRWKRQHTDEIILRACLNESLGRVWLFNLTKGNILSGFRSTGIHLLNCSKYLVARLDPEKLARYEKEKNT